MGRLRNKTRRSSLSNRLRHKPRRRLQRHVKTQSAQQLNQVQKKGTEAPVNQDKVDRLKKAIQSGEYKVNPEVLANKIAKLEGEIFGTK